MKKTVLMVAALLCTFACFAQVVDFEELELAPNSDWTGIPGPEDGDGSTFTSSYLTFYNINISEWNYWEGFAYTNGTDSETYSYTNNSAVAGHGNANSEYYVTCYMGWYNKSAIKIDTENSGSFENRGAYFCLPTYVSKYVDDENASFMTNHRYYSIKITAYADGTELDNRDVVMADFRGDLTYKMDDWTYVDLSWIDGADSLYFEAVTDDGATPYYFSMDDFGAQDPSIINYTEIVDFEELTLQPNSSWVGSDGTGRFTSSYLTLYNNYNSTYSSWEGFAYTNGTNTTDNSYNNISSAAGHGANNSANYAVCYVGSEWTPPYAPIPSGIKIDTEHAVDFTNRGAYFCLTYYCSEYIAENYPTSHSYYKIKISAFANGTELGNREVVMADFSEGNTYKMDEWTYVDLSWINGADSINFITESNDPTYYTPNYFCMDDFGAPNPGPVYVDTNFAESLSIDAYFDAAGMLNLNCESRINDVYVYDMAGRLVKNISVNDNNVSMPFDGVNGMYIVSARTEKGMAVCKIINNR